MGKVRQAGGVLLVLTLLLCGPMLAAAGGAAAASTGRTQTSGSTRTAGTTGRTGATGTTGARVRVALFGDSVTESLLLPNYLTRGLAPQLSGDERPFGFVPGGIGTIMAGPFRFHYNRFVSYQTGPPPPNGWTTIGDGLLSGFDGPSGYSAVATSPLATATVTVDDPDLEILYTSTSGQCLFGVSAAGHEWEIDTYRPGASVDTESPITLPPGPHLVTIHGPNCGLLEFDGIIAEDPVPAGKVQMEISNNGHAGVPPWTDLQPRVEALLADERYDVSVFLYGWVAELGVEGQSVTSLYIKTMLERAKLARSGGGSCLVVAPTPAEVPPGQVPAIAGIDREIARRGRCEYTQVLIHLWPSWQYGVKHGLLFVDGLHPTAKGYTLIAKALAPVIAKVARAHVAHPLVPVVPTNAAMETPAPPPPTPPSAG